MATWTPPPRGIGVGNDQSTTGRFTQANSHAGQAAFGGQMMNSNGTPVAPGTSIQDWTKQQEAWTAANSGSNLHDFLSGAATTLVRVGAGGLMAIAPELG